MEEEKREFFQNNVTMFIAALVIGFALGFLYNSPTFSWNSFWGTEENAETFGADLTQLEIINELLMIEGDVIDVSMDAIRVRTSSGEEITADTTKETVYQKLETYPSEQEVIGLFGPSVVPHKVSAIQREDVKTGSRVQVFFIEDMTGKAKGTASAFWLK